jgi:hypothetical protein
MTEIKMYFGTNKKEDDPVIDEEFKHFVKVFLLPKFRWFNISVTEDYWDGEMEICYVVTLLLQDDVSTRKDVIFICNRYCENFQQDCVLVSYNKLQEMCYYGK